MNKKRSHISPNEINKFCYCPYQWYYEKTYGQSFLRQEHSKKIKALGLTDTTKSNLKKGLEFHNLFKFKYKFKFLFFIILFILIIIFIATLNLIFIYK